MCNDPKECKYFAALLESRREVEDLHIKLAAEQAKVNAAEESAENAREEAETVQSQYNSKRAVMNSLYAASVAMRKAQQAYFHSRTVSAFTALKEVVAALDAAIEEAAYVAKHGSPRPEQITFQEGIA